MQGTPERQELQRVLAKEKAGSAMIHALADYARLKELEYQIAHVKADVSEHVRLRLELQKEMFEWRIEMRGLEADAAEYIDAFENAGKTLHSYFFKYDGRPWRVLLDDLREINKEKSRRTS